MSNTLTSTLKAHLTKTFQASLEEKLVVMELANMRLQDMSRGGTTITIPRIARHYVGSYAKYTDGTAQDITTANDQLVINQTPFIMFSYDASDKLENYLDVVSAQVQRDVFSMKRHIEGKFFAEYANAGLNNGTAVALSKTVTDANYAGNVVGTALASLSNDGCDTSKLALVVDPFQLNTIGISSLGNTFNVADETIKRGYKGQFMGFDVYVSNNLSFTATLAVGTQPGDGYYVDVNGVRFTFVTTLGTTAGNVLRGADAAASIANFVSAINGTSGAGTTYVDVGQEVRNDKLAGISAAGGSGVVNLTSIHGYRKVSSQNTAAIDWQDAVIHCVAMEKGAIDMVLQKEVSIEERDETKNLVTNYFIWSKFGIKTTAEGAKRLYDLRLIAQADEA